MRDEPILFNHVKGESAYLMFWTTTFNCLRSIRSLKSRYPNLELMVFDKKEIIAYKYDCPDDLCSLNLDESGWQIYDKKRFSAAIWINNVMLIYTISPD